MKKKLQGDGNKIVESIVLSTVYDTTHIEIDAFGNWQSFLRKFETFKLMVVNKFRGLL